MMEGLPVINLRLRFCQHIFFHINLSFSMGLNCQRFNYVQADDRSSQMSNLKVLPSV